VRRHELIHLLQAVAAVVGEDEFVVIGSQAVLAAVPDPPEALLHSMEADLYPRAAPERAVEIDGAVGEGSPFQELYGYWGHGVGPETPIAPAGWQGRLLKLELPELHTLGTRTVTAWCLSPSDLVLSKLAAGRPKDLAFASEALRAGLVDAAELERGLELMPAEHRDATRRSLRGVVARAGPDRDSRQAKGT
jgi:hypothetical protein